MTTVKHTPGDWFVVKRDTTFDVETKDGMHVVRTSWHHSMRKPYPLKDEAQANAHLIAAAPEMLEALKEAQANFKTYDRFKVDVDAMRKIEAAIAKAEGRALTRATQTTGDSHE